MRNPYAHLRQGVQSPMQSTMQAPQAPQAPVSGARNPMEHLRPPSPEDVDKKLEDLSVDDRIATKLQRYRSDEVKPQGESVEELRNKYRRKEEVGQHKVNPMRQRQAPKPVEESADDITDPNNRMFIEQEMGQDTTFQAILQRGPALVEEIIKQIDDPSSDINPDNAMNELYRILETELKVDLDGDGKVAGKQKSGQDTEEE